ncbi:hypothetical protein KJ855_00930 [Patescibacteria group bacterium]|nr:hypothetical protein [Patescibacteria group bacterium]
MKKIFAILLGLIMTIVMLPNTARADIYIPMEERYDYEIVEKSPDPVLSPGETTILWVKLRNTGFDTWYSDRYDFREEDCWYGKCYGGNYPVRLGTKRPQDRNSMFYTVNNWISGNRAHMADEQTASQGEIMSFGFFVTAPDYLSNGVYVEHFAPVVESKYWMPDKGIAWNIRIEGQAERYEAVIEGDSWQTFELNAGEEAEVSFVAGNTGGLTWDKNGAYPVHIANRYDYASDYYLPGVWLADNRPGDLDNSQVYPGDNGVFTFRFKAPENAYTGQSFVESFWLVAEGKQWFDYGSNKNPFVLEVKIVGENGARLFDTDNSTFTVDKTRAKANNDEEVKLEFDIRDKYDEPIASRDIKVVTDYTFADGYYSYDCFKDRYITTDKYGYASETISCDVPAGIWFGYQVDVNGHENDFESGSEWLLVKFYDKIPSKNYADVDIYYNDEYFYLNDINTYNHEMFDIVYDELENLNPDLIARLWEDEDVDKYRDYDWIEVFYDDIEQFTSRAESTLDGKIYSRDFLADKLIIVFDNSYNTMVLIKEQNFDSYRYLGEIDSERLEDYLYYEYGHR